MNEVFDLEAADEVGCVHCMGQNCHDTYRRGSAFLAGPCHTPCDGNANYVCLSHLDDDAVIWDGAQRAYRHPSTNEADQ